MTYNQFLKQFDYPIDASGIWPQDEKGKRQFIRERDTTDVLAGFLVYFN